MIPGLEGPGGKMSASNENGTIYTTDSPNVVKKICDFIEIPYSKATLFSVELIRHFTLFTYPVNINIDNAIDMLKSLQFNKNENPLKHRSMHDMEILPKMLPYIFYSELRCISGLFNLEISHHV